MRNYIAIFVIVLVFAGCQSNSSSGAASLPPVRAVTMDGSVSGSSQDTATVLSLSATSYDPQHPTRMAFDGDPATYWQPFRNSWGEGLMVVLAKPVKRNFRLVVSCADKYTGIEVYVNGEYYTRINSQDGVQLWCNDKKISSIYLKFMDNDVKVYEIKVGEGQGDAAVPLKLPQIVAAKVTASSELTPKPAYDPRQLFDGRLDFGWAEGVAGNGEGESFGAAFDAPHSVDGFYIANGYQRSEDHFKKNARVKTLGVYADGTLVKTVDLKDAMGYQYVALDAPVSCREVRFRIVSVYPGSKYEDTVVSEVKFSSGGRVIDVQTDLFPDISARTVAAARNTVLENFIDRNMRMHLDISSGHGHYYLLEINFRSNGSFAIWKNEETLGEGFTGEEAVYDGNWTIDSAGRNRAVVTIFGRKHILKKHSEFSDPYTSDMTSTVLTTIFSDKLVITPFVRSAGTANFADNAFLRSLSRFMTEPEQFEGCDFILSGQTINGLFPYDNQEI